MKKVVKSLAITLALAMALSMVPAVNSYAAPKKAKNKVVYEFKNGTMTIKGKGKMPDSMRFVNNKKIKKVVIKKGVTYVSKYAFSGCKNLKSVKIANTVKEIGWHSFEGTKIKKITIPKSVKTIGNQAFYNCDNLKTITMPGDFKVKIKDGDEEVWEIMSGKKIKTINLNSKLKLENAKYFEGTKWNVSKKDAKYKSIDGVIYSKDGKDIVRVPSGLKELTIANGCETFNLQSIFYAEHIPDDGIYACCSMLEKITLPETLKYVEYQKYRSEYAETQVMALKDIVIKSKQIDSKSIVALTVGLKEVAGDDFGGDYTFGFADIAAMFPDRIELKDNFYILDKKVVLYYTGKDETVTIPEGLFTYCRSLEKVNIPKNIKKIKKNAFDGTKVDVQAFLNNSNLKTIGAYAFYGTDWTEIVVPAHIETIGKMAITSGAEGNKKVIIEGSAKGYKNDAFSTYPYGEEKDATLSFKSGVKDYFTSLNLRTMSHNKKRTKTEVEVAWAKVEGVDGYELQVSSGKKFKKVIKKVEANKNKTIKTIKMKKNVTRVSVTLPLQYNEKK